MPQRGVYQIRNLVNGRVYVGASDNLRARWFAHKTQLRTGKHPARRLQNDFWEHGLAAFGFEVLEGVPEGIDLKEAEQRHLDRLCPFDPNVGYNTHLDAVGPTGLKRTPEHRRKISEALTGQAFAQDRCDAISAGRKSSARAQTAVRDLNRSKRLLTDDDVRSIVRMRNEGATVMAIAEAFGLTRRPVRAILGGETYADITKIRRQP